MNKALGLHVIAELSNCREDLLGDLDLVRAVLTRAAEVAGAEVLQVVAHRFSPQGISGIAVIAESHLSIHTWPELGYAAVDVYTCGPHTDPERACRYLAEALGCQGFALTALDRGLPGPSGSFGHAVRPPA